MKKLAIATILVMLLSISSYAQFKMGARFGVNTNNITLLEDIRDDNYKLTYADDNRVGFHFGLTSQLQISKIFIQPEFLFSTNSNDIFLTDLRDGEAKIGKQSFNKIDIPVVAGIKFGKLKLGVGPVATFNINSKSELLDKYQMKQNFQGATLGYQLAGGLDFDGFNIELRYESSFKNAAGVRIGSKDFYFDQRMSQLILSTAIYF